VAAPPQLATAFLSRAISTFCVGRSDVRVVIRSAPTADVIDIVVRQQVDIGIVYAPFGSRITVARQIGTTEIACAMHPEHSLANKSFVTPSLLRKHRIISYRPETPLRQCVERTFRKAGIPLVVHIETNMLSACALAKEGAGVALIDPLIMIGDIFKGIIVKPFRPVTRLGVQLIFPRDRPMSRLAKAFSVHLEKSLPMAQ
jgi:DNA-binding transcriptional LysR family regulator